MRLFAPFAALLLISTPVMAQDALSGDWQVERLDGKPLAAGSVISLRFANSRLSGKACNNLGASYSVKNGDISFGETMATRMACARPIMIQEQRLLSLLRGPVRWARSGERLTLSNVEGGSLTALRKR